MKRQKQPTKGNRLDTLRDNKTYMMNDECLIYALAKIEPTAEELAYFIYYKYGNIEYLLRLARKLQEQEVVERLEAANDIILQMKLKQIRHGSRDAKELQSCLKYCTLNELCGMQRDLDLDPTIESEERVYLDYNLEKAIRNSLLAKFTQGRNQDEYDNIALGIIAQTENTYRRELPTIKKHITSILRNTDYISEAYEQELEQELNKIISEIARNPKSPTASQFSYPWLCGIKRHLKEKSDIEGELKATIDEQLTKEIHNCILEIYKYGHSYKDTESIVTEVREEEQPTVREFLENIQREVALKRLHSALTLIKNGLYVGHLKKYTLEELCESERYLTEEGAFEQEDKGLIEPALQSAIEYRVETEASIYRSANTINELLDRANPLDRDRIKAHIEDYTGKRFAVHPTGQNNQ